MGIIGEKIIINYLSEQGCKINHSVNKFDAEKDFTADDKKIEVKTQVPFMKENSFSIREKQLVKCRSVDSLYFISVPTSQYEDKWAGWIFHADPKTFITKNKKTRDGRTMVLIHREQEALTPIKRIDDSEIKMLRSVSVSNF